MSGATRYPGYFSKITLAFIAAQLIVLYEEEHSFRAIFSNPYYYVALLASMGIALVIIQLVFWITRWLDYQFPWSRSYRLRLPRQFIFGLLLPLFPLLLLASAYFAYFEINILHTVYFKRYLQQIVWMLLTLNGLLFYWWSIANKQKGIPKAMLTNLLPAPPTLAQHQDIACIFIEHKNYFAYRFDGEKIIWQDTLANSIALLDAYQFFLVNRSCIINRKAIVAVKVLTSKRTKLELSLEKMAEVEVSQRENSAFKKWLALSAIAASAK